MIIKIDNRETELLDACKFMISCSSSFKDLILEVVNLPIGDVIICDDKCEKVIIERKSLNDLAASIKDGRYDEQSYRLNGSDIHNHNIIYLIEGEWSDYAKYKYKGRITEQTLISSIISINYFKGFSLYRTSNTRETSAYILHLADKLEREKNKKKPHYSNTEDNITSSNNIIEKYCEVSKRVKKDNVTVDNIGEILLSQIPNVSSQSSMAIMEKFKTIKNLINNLESDPTCLNNITTSKNGKSRRLNKNCISNIFTFLLQPEKEKEIK